MAVGVMLLPPRPAAGSFPVAVTWLLGFVVVAQVLLQFLLVARFPGRTMALGLDAILHAHRRLGVAIGVALLAHIIILALWHPLGWSLLHPQEWSGALLYGVLATASLLGVIGLTYARRRIRLPYEWWRLTHVTLGITAAIFAMLHISGFAAVANAPYKRWFWVMFAVVAVLPLTWRRVVLPARARRMGYRVASVQDLGGGYVMLNLDCSSAQPMRFLPGQFVWLTMGSPWSADEHPLSIASNADDPAHVRFLIREVGDFTRSVRSRQPGAAAFLDGPHGHLTIDQHPQANGFVCIARGAGVAPFLGILATMVARGDQRPVLLILSTAVEAHQHAIDQMLRPVCGGSVTVVRVVSHPSDAWHEDRGHVDRALLTRVLPQDARDRIVMMCGPDALLLDAEAALTALGVPRAHVHTESFEVA